LFQIVYSTRSILTHFNYYYKYANKLIYLIVSDDHQLIIACLCNTWNIFHGLRVGQNPFEQTKNVFSKAFFSSVSQNRNQMNDSCHSQRKQELFTCRLRKVPENACGWVTKTSRLVQYRFYFWLDEKEARVVQGNRVAWSMQNQLLSIPQWKPLYSQTLCKIWSGINTKLDKHRRPKVFQCKHVEAHCLSLLNRCSNKYRNP